MARWFPHARLLVTVLLVACAPGALQAASLDPATWRGDARFLAAAADSIHPRPYHLFKRAQWDSAATELEARLPSLRYDQAVAAFSRLIGMLGDGHSRLGQIELPNHGPPQLTSLPGPGFQTRYPIDCDVFADGLWIVAATAPRADLAGAHVVAMGGKPAAAAVASITPLIPADNPMWTLNVLPAFLRSPGYLRAVGLVAESGTLRLTLESHGRRREVELKPEAPDSNTRWVEADAGTHAPLPLTRHLPGPFSYADLGDSARSVFVRIRAIVNEPGGESMADFVARLFAHVDSLGSRRLILDLRGNGGGNNYLNQPMVHALIQRPQLDRPGHLFAIVDRGTFSAAVSLSADLERETHCVFVGEPTGGAPDSPGDPAHVTLPASGLVVRISTVLWNGSDPRDPRAFIAPDLPAMPTYGDWLAHRDPALSAIDAWRPSGEPEVPPNTHWGSQRKLEARLPVVAW